MTTTDFNYMPAKIAAELARLEQRYGPLPEIETLPPECPVCEDRGVISYNVPFGDPRFGKLYKCPMNCTAVRRNEATRASKVMNQSAWEEDYAHGTFESWRAFVEQRFSELYMTLTEEEQGYGAMAYKSGAYAVAMAFAHYAGTPFTLDMAADYAFSEKNRKVQWPYRDDTVMLLSPSVVLTGDVGVGKTWLAVAATNELWANGHPAVFSRVQAIIKRIQDTYGESSTEFERDVMDFFIQTPLLIIDEFGIKNFKADRLEKFEEIMRERDRKGLGFMATTNLTQSEFYDQWGKQTGDVVAKAHWVPMAGIKIRQTAKQARIW